MNSLLSMFNLYVVLENWVEMFVCFLCEELGVEVVWIDLMVCKVVVVMFGDVDLK